ncbi:hypothetical protein Lal_00036201 [Lupinus albus]|nr:hypothetical protein Lal_00036201 [Lupinus albus]
MARKLVVSVLSKVVGVRLEVLLRRLVGLDRRPSGVSCGGEWVVVVVVVVTVSLGVDMVWREMEGKKERKKERKKDR